MALREEEGEKRARQSAGERPDSRERAHARVPEVEGRDRSVAELWRERLRARVADPVVPAQEEEGEKRARQSASKRLSRARGAYRRLRVVIAVWRSSGASACKPPAPIGLFLRKRKRGRSARIRAPARDPTLERACARTRGGGS